MVSREPWQRCRYVLCDPGTSSGTHRTPRNPAPLRGLMTTAFAFLRRSAAQPVLLLLLLLLALPFASGQEFRGTISGAVTDSSGAAVPGAAVVVKEIHTGTVNRTRSDSAGQYVVPFLLPGDYQITVTQAGFETEVRNNIPLQSQEHPIVNLQLKVGNTAETVTVTAAPPLIDEANASVGQVISTASVEDLPLN